MTHVPGNRFIYCTDCKWPHQLWAVGHNAHSIVYYSQKRWIFATGLRESGGLNCSVLLGSSFHQQNILLNRSAIAKVTLKIKKALRETQTLHAGCSKAEPKNFAPPQTPFPGA